MRLEELLNGRPPTAFSAAQLADRAQSRWDRSQLDEAYVLFRAAAEAAPRETGPDRSVVYLAKAAMTRHEAGDEETARRLFDYVLAFDWRSSGPALLSDAHVVEWAYVARLERARDPATFDALYVKAAKHCAELGWSFPRIHSKQDVVIDRAVKVGADRIVRALVDRIANRRPQSQLVRDRLQQVQRWLDTRPPPG
ncbi:MAG: hypothetical protein R3F59_05805 [Myxococcota bacterium]